MCNFGTFYESLMEKRDQPILYSEKGGVGCGVCSCDQLTALSLAISISWETCTCVYNLICKYKEMTVHRNVMAYKSKGLRSDYGTHVARKLELPPPCPRS